MTVKKFATSTRAETPAPSSTCCAARADSARSSTPSRHHSRCRQWPSTVQQAASAESKNAASPHDGSRTWSPHVRSAQSVTKRATGSGAKKAPGPCGGRRCPASATEVQSLRAVWPTRAHFLRRTTARRSPVMRLPLSSALRRSPVRRRSWSAVTVRCRSALAGDVGPGASRHRDLRRMT